MIGIQAAGPIAALPKIGSNVITSDPSYAKNTVLLLGNGMNASTTVVDQMGNIWTASGNAQLSTTTPKYGSASWLFDGSGDYLSSTITSVIGTADFTVEAWIRLASLATDCEIFCVSHSDLDVAKFDLVFETKTTGALRGSIQNGANVAQVDISSAGSLLAINTWYHVAFTAESTTARLRIDGVVVASGTISGTRVQGNTAVRVGYLSNALAGAVVRYFNGRVDDLRVTKALCRYSGAGAITPPAAQLPSFPSVKFESNFTSSGAADAQGVASDGTNVWYTTSTSIFKYTTAGVLVTSRNVSGDAPLTKSQVNGCYLRNGTLFVSAAVYDSGTSTGTSWIVEYNPTTLAYITHHQLSGNHFSEGLAWNNGYWWVIFHSNMHVCVFDQAWTLRETYSLSFSVTGSSGGYGAGTGYDGIAWYGNYLICNVHEIYNEDFVDVYAWTGSGFSEVARLLRPSTSATQGISLDPVDPTILWFAERVYPAGTDRVAKIRLS